MFRNPKESVLWSIFLDTAALELLQLAFLKFHPVKIMKASGFLYYLNDEDRVLF
jgi:hypothetical protein